MHIWQISLIPKHTTHPHIVRFRSSVSAWILKTLLNILKIRIQSGVRIIRTTFIPKQA
jgi:hypothetical protein